ncbi:MerR family transcriptional regulator [Nocardia concava]|uniref:MerR family transcriptional regulator n=1 Tax=Nocardia concava TaxID=257281 RepID=UPI0002DE535E|nr:helix-turn-helix domain-containing protein [Nocardia concava]
MELLTIGAFARLARLSPKALRLYADAGILPPARVDPHTGYRWYSQTQLPQARHIARLRQLDMPLARIGEVFACPADQRAQALTEYWIEQERAFTAKRQLADFLITQLTGKKVAMYPVSVRTIPERALLSRTENLAADRIGEFATPLFALFGGPSVPRPDGLAGLPFLRYHGELGPDDDAPVEFCCPVRASDLDTVAQRFPDMLVRNEPAAREAYVEVPKSAMTTALGFESLHQWLLEHNEQSDWRPRQIFLRDPTRADESDTVYELAVRLI